MKQHSCGCDGKSKCDRAKFLSRRISTIQEQLRVLNRIDLDANELMREVLLEEHLDFYTEALESHYHFSQQRDSV